jgi:hypothetical protein
MRETGDGAERNIIGLQGKKRREKKGGEKKNGEKK